MMLFHLNDYQYIIHLKKKYPWREFQRKAKITPGTYSEIFAKRIYSSVFKYSINLVEEYQKYYKNEYKSINQFLFWRHGISEKILNQLSKKLNGYLASFSFDYYLFDDEIFKTSLEHFFRELDERR